MASDERPGEEIRAREDAARAREAAAEGREAERQREAEFPPHDERGDREPNERGVVPSDADEERTGVMPPPRAPGPTDDAT